MADFLYESEAGVYRPTKWAASPWSRTSQHGGPVNAIFAREAERLATEIEMQIARVTVDLFKAVPLEPLCFEARMLRKGGRIAVAEMHLHPDGDASPVCHATVVFLRPRPHSNSYWEAPESSPVPFAETKPRERSEFEKSTFKMPPGFHEWVETRSGVDDAGPFVWMTASIDLVKGEAISSFQRASALTDMTLGSQMRMAYRRGSGRPRGGGAFMINTDTTAYWERPFEGDHLGLRTALISEENGIGTAEAILYDSRGRVGRSLQSALVQGSMATP